MQLTRKGVMKMEDQKTDEPIKINMQLISDKTALNFLKKFDEKGKDFEETKNLLKRKISGDNPSKKEWRKNANTIANVNINGIGYAFPNVNINAYDYAYAFANANATDSCYIAYVNVKVTDNTYVAFSSDISPDPPYSCYIAIVNAYDIADYIIDLLNGYIEPIEQLDSKVLNAIHKCALDLEKWIINFHPKGAELEKHFGKWMAATIIHKISTGEYFFSSKKKVIRHNISISSLDNPQVTINNIPIAVVPNSVKFTEGFGEQNMRATSSGWVRTNDKIGIAKGKRRWLN